MEQRKNKYAYDRDYYRSVSEQLYGANGGDYLEGNAARKLYVMPDLDEDGDYAAALPERRRRGGEQRREERQNRPAGRAEKSVRTKKVRNIDLRHVLVLMAAIGALVFASYRYLEAQSDLVQMNKNIKLLSSSISSLEDKNDAVRASLSEAYDPEYVFAFAVEKLGMVYPDKNQVYKYERSENGYVRQYENIPE